MDGWEARMVDGLRADVKELEAKLAVVQKRNQELERIVAQAGK